MRAISDKQGLLVKQKMENYEISKEQKDQLNEAIKTNL